MLKKFKFEILIIAAFILIHLPSLGYDTFNTDSWKWKARIYDFGSGVFGFHFERTIQKYHPGVPLMWIGAIAVKVYNLYYDLVFKTNPADNSLTTVFELNFIQKLFIVMTIAITLAFVFYPLKKLFGTRYAVIFVLFLSLEPFYIALTREIHLEGLMSTFMLASFVWLYYWLRDKKKHRLILSGIFAALAVLTKSSSLSLLPLSGILMFLNEYFDSKNFRQSLINSLKIYFVWLLLFIAGFVLIWPAMWVAPLKALDTVYRGIFTIGVERGHEQFYFSKYVLDPGYSFYFVILALKSSIYLIPGLIGFLFIRKRLDSNKQRFALYSFLFGIIYFIEISYPSAKLDRYLIPTILSFVFISTFFYERLHKYLLLALIIPGILILVSLHPDYFSYYSPYFGGLSNGIKIVEPKWLIGEPAVSKYFSALKVQKNLESFAPDDNLERMLNNSQSNNKLVIAFQEKYYTQIWPFISQIGGRAIIESLTPYAKKANYFVYPVWDDASVREKRFKLQYVGSISERGVNLYNVYQKI
ncbi:MAG TPA: glycosyltransferase family 39 protein [Candidatus Saccharimonadales bacterium]|nr:glycosyltransferase family 39 protein [Candidatus Saccharimonadales bacterium]